MCPATTFIKPQLFIIKHIINDVDDDKNQETLQWSIPTKHRQKRVRDTTT
jgi:hypothetical protein